MTPGNGQAADRSIPSLSSVRAALRVARTRALRAGFTAGAVYGLGAAALVFAALRLVAGLTDGPSGWLASIGPDSIALIGRQVIASILAGIAVTIGLGILRWAALPDVLGLARRAERRYGLDERLSTALEVHDSDHRSAPMSLALLADAEHRGAFDPAGVIPFRLSPVAWAVPALLAAALVLGLLPELVPGDGRPPAIVVAVPAPELSEAERAAAAADLRRIADLMAGEAERLDDPYVGAVARQLQQLGEQVSSGSTPRSDLAASLERLSSYAREALADRPGTPSALPALLDAARERIAPAPGEDTAIAAAEPGATRDAGASGDAPQPGDAPAAGPRGPGAPMDPADIERQLAELEAAAEQRANAPAAEPPPPGQASGNYFEAPSDPRIELERRLAEDMRQAMNQGERVGGAQDADVGGDLAGQGVRPLGNDEQGLIARGEPGEELLLPGMEREGRQIRIDLAPETVTADVDSAAAGPGAWRKGPSSAAARTRVAISDRAVLQRYFARDAGENPASR